MNKKIKTAELEHKCRARYHMSMAEYALYDLAMAWTDGGKKMLNFDGPKMAKQFREGSKQHMYKLESALVQMGWLVLAVDKSRRSNGHWSSRTYHVITHDQWVANKVGDCPEIDSEGVTKKPVNHVGTVKKAKGQTTLTTQPDNLDNPARQPRQPSQSTIEAKACKSKHVEAKRVEKKRVGLRPAFPGFPNAPSFGRPLTDSEAACSVPPDNHGGTVEKPVNHGGTVEFRGVDQGYFDARTGKPLYYADLNERLSPNTYNGGKFFDPNGNEITLAEAQEKELVTA